MRSLTSCSHRTRPLRRSFERLEDRRLLAVYELGSLLPENGGDGLSGFVASSDSDTDDLGHRVSAGGDVNGDGFDDLIISANNADTVAQKGGPKQQQNEGAVYIVFGGASGMPAEVDVSSLNGVTGLAILGSEANKISLGRSSSRK